MKDYKNCILIIDDSAPFLRLFAESMIDNDDIDLLDHIIFCQNVEDGVKEYVIHHPIVVLMDIKMPGRSGIEGAQLLREIDPNACIFFLSNYPNDPDAAKAISKHFASGILDKSVGTGVISGILGFIIKLMEKAI